MRQAVNIDLNYNSNNIDAIGFITFFKSDLTRCLNRFKVNPTFTENESRQDDPALFFLSANDLNNSIYVKKLESLPNHNNNIYVVLLDTLKKNEFEQSLYKFHQFRFWDEVVETGELRLFRNDIPESLSYYWERITDIAVEVYEKFAITGTRFFKPKVYLAQTDSAQASSRDNIRRDLNELGYDVFPEKNLSPSLDECTNEVLELVKESSLIIHPIPLNYSTYFNEKSISIVEHQCNITSQYLIESKEDIKRLIWIPSEIEITDEENLIFVEKILRDQEQIHNSKILKVTLEELKKNYRRVLSGEDTEDEKEKNQLPDIYFIADEELESLKNPSIAKESNGNIFGYNKKGITYNQHLKNLANAQVVVVNYTSDNKEWFSVKVNEILKSPGLNISRPFKKLILLKGSADLNTCNLDTYFSEVHTGSIDNIKLDLEVTN